MPVVQVDRRRIEYEEAPEEHLRLVAARGPWLDLALARARDLAVVMERKAWWAQECASFEAYVRLLGYPVLESRDLAWLGRGLRVRPALEEEVRSGAVALEQACLLARLLVEDLVRAQEDPVALARTPARDLRALVRRRLEEKRQQTPRLQTVTVHVPEATCRAFGQAREIASRRARRPLSEGETFGVVVDHYLDAHDPLRRKGRARRVGPTSERPRDRYVPRAVRRDVRLRSGGICEVGGCPRPATQVCHLTPHAEGSAREVGDVWEGCPGDHKLYDAGLLRHVGMDPEGRPIFRDAHGRVRLPDPRPPP